MSRPQSPSTSLWSAPSGPLPNLDLPEDYLRNYPSTTKPFRPGWTPPEAMLPPDQLPWLPIARQILADGCDSFDPLEPDHWAAGDPARYLPSASAQMGGKTHQTDAILLCGGRVVRSAAFN